MLDRTPKELIDYMAFAVQNDGVGAIMFGDNELAGLVLDWRDKDERLRGIEPTPETPL